MVVVFASRPGFLPRMYYIGVDFNLLIFDLTLTMHKLTDILHKTANHKNTHPVPSSLPQFKLTCSEQDLYRYRKQRGVNLGISISRAIAYIAMDCF